MRRSATVLLTTLALTATPAVALAASPPQNAVPVAVMSRLVGSGDTSHVSLYLLLSSGAERRLTTTTAGMADVEPHFSPDGRRVAFERDLPDGTSNVFTVGVGGGAPTQLTHCVGDQCGSNAPVWTPDGRSIVFERYATANDGVVIDGIAIMKSDGSGIRQLTVNPDSDETGDDQPAVSPDGRTIAFSRGRVSATGEESSALMTVGIDGTRFRQLTGYGVDPDEKDWSPDGSTIAFTIHQSASSAFRADVATIRSDGTHLRVLTRSTPGEVYEYAPSYSPSGRAILYTVGTSTCADLYVMAADGSHQTPVTRTPTTCEFGADWDPRFRA